MRIVLWFEYDEIQCALANRIAKKYDVVGIVKERRVPKRKVNLARIVEYFVERIFLNKYRNTWFLMKEHYKNQYQEFPDTMQLEVENINSGAVKEFTESLYPDLILVSGTRLVRKSNLETKCTIGILNLHTGLSPYIKGGPNCTNWCLAAKKYAFIGNTIMWIDPGIDSGNILLSNFVVFDRVFDFFSLHKEIMDQAHNLYIEAIDSVNKDILNCIPQSEIAMGHTYFSKDWNLYQKIAMVMNFKKFLRYIRSSELQLDRLNIKVVT